MRRVGKTRANGSSEPLFHSRRRTWAACLVTSRLRCIIRANMKARYHASSITVVVVVVSFFLFLLFDCLSV